MTPMQAKARMKKGMTKDIFLKGVSLRLSLKVPRLLIGKEPFVTLPSLSHCMMVRSISAKPSVAMAR